MYLIPESLQASLPSQVVDVRYEFKMLSMSFLSPGNYTASDINIGVYVSAEPEINTFYISFSVTHPGSLT